MTKQPQKPRLVPIERRTAPRYRVDLPCYIVTESGRKAGGKINDLSLAGLQLRGNSGFMRVLYPTLQRPDWRRPLKIQVFFSIPTVDQAFAPVQLSCQMINCSRLNQDRYRVGCQFLHIDSESQQALTNFIELANLQLI